MQPTGSVLKRAAAVRRVRARGRYVDQGILNLCAGLSHGYAAPQILVRGVLIQLFDILATAPTRSPFASPSTGDSTPAFRAALSHDLGASLYPAMRRYRDFLRGEYLSRARPTLGVSVLPNGQACYAATVRLHTSLELSADSIHRLGLAEIARLDTEMRGG